MDRQRLRLGPFFRLKRLLSISLQMEMDRQHFGLKGPDSKSRLSTTSRDVKLFHHFVAFLQTSICSSFHQYQECVGHQWTPIPFSSSITTPTSLPFPTHLQNWKKNLPLRISKRAGEPFPPQRLYYPRLVSHMHDSSKRELQQRQTAEREGERESLRMGLKDALGMSSSLVSDSIQRNRSPLEEFSADIDN